jgi:thymidylate synthase (FAD)
LQIVKPSFEILDAVNGVEILKKLELIGRTCYKSEDRITADSAPKFVKMLIDRGHHAMLEHCSISVKFVVDRGVSHELVRHRLCSFAQESTRYCNYGNDDKGITVIEPLFFKDKPEWHTWQCAMDVCEGTYLSLLKNGASPQEARSVLPNSLKTEIVITANLREWRTIFTQRTAAVAHPQMQEVMRPALTAFKSLIPVVFDDINN